MKTKRIGFPELRKFCADILPKKTIDFLKNKSEILRGVMNKRPSEQISTK